MHRIEKKVFTIKGMDCADCAIKGSKRQSLRFPGVKLAHISFATEKLKGIL